MADSHALATHAHGAVDHAPHAHQFEDAEQQYESVVLGMWAFLATEVLFFGALFCAYAVYRYLHYDAYAASAEELDTTLGFINTLVLLVSSFTMALGVHASQEGHKRKTTLYLVATIVFAFAFLVIKYFEYKAKYDHHLMPGMQHFADFGTLTPYVKLFFSIYFAMTGLHAIHIIIGIGLLATMVFLNEKNWFGPQYYSPVEMTGLYWHFVDVVWVFLFPLLYLIPKVHH